MKKVIFLFGFTILIFFWGCSENGPVNSPKSGESGKVALSFDKLNAPAGVVNIKATLTREGFTTVSGNLNIQSDTSATLLLTGLDVGTWHLVVEASDSANVVIYTGAADILIQAGLTTQVALTLQPTGSGTGDVFIQVIWGTPPVSGWKVIPVYFNCDFHAVYFLNNNKGFSAGTNGTLLMTTDGGTNWIKKTINTTQVLSGIAFINDNLGFVTGYGGTLFRTLDGGETWTKITVNVSDNLYSIRFKNNTGIITCGGGKILRTTNGGETWTSQTLQYNNPGLLINSAFVENVMYVFGTGGNLFRSSDNGAVWYTTSNSLLAGWVQSGYFFSTSTGILAGGSGQLIKTTNDGGTWQHIPLTSEHLEELFFINNTTGWLVGDHGTIYKTTNQGSSWQKQVSNTNKWLNSVCFISEHLGFAVGQNSTILKYTGQ